MAASLSFESPPFSWVTLGQARPLPGAPPDKVAFGGRREAVALRGRSHLRPAESVPRRGWELGGLCLGLGWGDSDGGGGEWGYFSPPFPAEHESRFCSVTLGRFLALSEFQAHILFFFFKQKLC